MDLVEALHTLARQRGRGDSPLVALRSVPARPGARISHLPIGQGLAQAWISVTGEPFHQHQSLALASLRRGEPLALVGGLPARQTMQLLALELLRAEAPATALLLAPDEPAAEAHRAGLARIAAALGEGLRVGLASGDEARAAMAAHIVVATPAALHERLLRYHDRAWAAFWSRLRLIVIAEAHSYDGLAAAHLAALILRARRLVPGERPPQLAATVAPVAAADEALALIGGAAWRMIPADDTPAPAAALALWRAPGERAREAVALALGLARANPKGLPEGCAGVHLTCPPFEAPLLRALIGPEEAAISVGPSPLPAAAQIFVGLAGATPYLRQALDGAALVALVLGDDPAERTIARLAAHDPEQLPLLDGPPPLWVVAPGNAYVSAQHLVCAASERPLAAAEVELWQAATIIPRLEQRGLLVGLPGPEPAWQPLPTGADPYQGFDLRGAGSAAAVIRDEQGSALGTLDQAAFDRWGCIGAALPPGRGGYRVTARDDAGLELSVRQSPEQRRTVPLRRCSVRVRDRRERRNLRGRELAWGRVVVDEEVYGYREASPGSAPAERALNPPISTSWSAPALWVDLPAPISAAGQLIGWSLAAALPLRAITALTELAPVYDAEARRLYFVDAQPGGSGLAVWLYTAIEELLPLAYDVALDCRNDPLLEPLARADMDWLLALLGGARGAPLAEQPPARREAAQPAPTLAPPARQREEQGRGRPEGRPSTDRAEQQRIEREQQQAREAQQREEQQRQERAERDRLAREAQQRAEQQRQERAERDRLAREEQQRAEQQRQERAEREEQERAERDRLAREAQQRAEQQRQERAEREAWEARELAARKAWEDEQRRAREARERAERETREREAQQRRARARAEREAQEARERAERAEREAQERAEREAQERAEREAQERAIREARARAEKAERDRIAREREAQEARERAERAERARIAREQAAAEARERAEEAERARAEQERIAQERAAAEARERAEEAERARAEQERIAQERKADANTPPSAGPRAPARSGRSPDTPRRRDSRSQSRQGQPPHPAPPRGDPAPPQRPAPPRAETSRRGAPPPAHEADAQPLPEVLPDAAAMVARLRARREQRERQGRRSTPPPARSPARPADPDEARFRPGDEIVCTPYGRGEVLASRVEDDHEILVVNFPDHGQLTIDAAVSAARLAEDAPPPDDDPPL